jgi:hypothetical protein
MASSVVVTEERVTVTEIPADVSVIEVQTQGPKGDPGEGLQLWNGASIAYTQFSVADVTSTVDAIEIPARAVIDKLIIKTAQPFLGGTISAYTLSLGLESDTSRYVLDYDAFDAASDTNYVVATVNELLSLTLAKSLKITAQSTGADLDEATQGRVEIFVKWALLPEIT